VKDALEAFRAEELADLDQGDDYTSDGGSARPQTSTGLPELDAEHLALAEAVAPARGSSTSSSQKPPPRNTGMDLETRNLILGGVALVVVVIAGILLWPSLRAWIEARNAEPEIVYDNQALEMLASDASPVEALEEAHEALKINNTAENRAILGEVRTAVVEQVKTLLNAPRYSRSNLDQASTLATNAGYLDSSNEIRNLKEEVDRELAAHAMVLLEIDAENQQATFVLNNRFFPEKEQTVGVGDMLQGRFIVQKIAPNYVRVEDTLRKGPGGPRTLMCRELTSVSDN
jgi:hypothetical protein